MLVIHNTGGMARMNSTDALQTIHSGPIAGIGAAEHLSSETGIGHVISTDMGGTSFDIGLVPVGGVKHYDFQPTIGRWLVSVPMIHLVTLGAGGGSIASYDRIHKGVKLGPESAGSDPGPACYDRGGLRATVTDADLLLGYLDPDNYANGVIKLNPKRSIFAIEETLCDELDMDVIQVAKEIKRGVDEQMAIGMAKELRVRGYLPEDFTMLAYGGNGPLHACGIANYAGIKRILAPPFASVFSALRRRKHETAALPRARRARRDVQRDHPCAVRQYTSSTRSWRSWRPSARGSGSPGVRPRGVEVPPRNGHALRKPARHDGRRLRPQPHPWCRVTSCT